MGTIPIPIHAKVKPGAQESSLKNDSATLENAYISGEGHITRFPSRKLFCPIPGSSPVFMKEHKGDLVAISGGRTYRINSLQSVTDVTEAYVSGSGRPTFANTGSELLMAAGGDIVRYRGDKVQKLSATAPKASYVLYVDGYVIAIEPDTGRFNHTPAGVYDAFDPMDTFSAEGKPDNISAAIITEFNELLLGGEESIELFDTSPQADKPFYRRYTLPSSIIAPYTMLSANNKIWGINKDMELVSFNPQLSARQSDDVQRKLEGLDDISGAWGDAASFDGERFIIIQFPNATNDYGTKGVTFAYDILKRRFSYLYGAEENGQLPTRWPVWSIEKAFGKTLVGGEGGIYELTGSDSLDSYVRWRSGHIRYSGSVKKLILHLERGFGAVNDLVEPILSIRVNRNNMGFGPWIRRNLGKVGKRNMILEYQGMGTADTWQLEIAMEDAGKCEISMAYFVV